MKLVKISKKMEVVMPFQLDSKESKIWFKHEGKEKILLIVLRNLITTQLENQDSIS